MTVRRMRGSDVGDVATLLRSSFDPKLRPYMTYAQEGIGEFLTIRMSRPEQFPDRTHLVYANDSDRAVAYAEFVESQPGVQFLSYICVASDMQRRGIASTLVTHFTHANGGASRVELEVLEHNSSALAMYRALGFDQLLPDHAEGGSTWSSRMLPAPAEAVVSDLEIPQLAVYEPMHATYGFSELPVRWGGRDVKFGRIGASVLRCYDAQSFADERLLGAVRRAFPRLTEALLITDATIEVPRNAIVVARTTRMTYAVAHQASEEGAAK